MARKSEEWWAAHESPTMIRCVGATRSGTRCLAKAEEGSVVCKNHGGAAPQVRKRAAERIIYTADEAAANLVKWMNDGSLPWGERVKIARDLMDRAGLAAAQVHKIVPAQEDPVEALFKKILSDPNGLADPLPARPAIEAGEVVRGDVVDPVQDAYDRYEESHMPDAEVVDLRSFGPVGPHDYRSKEAEVENGMPRPAPPGDARRWRAPDDAF